MTTLKATAVWVLLLAGAAQAQQSTPPGGAAQPGGDAAKSDTAKTDIGKSDAAKAGTSDFATRETYKTKDGGMYQPPAQRPASPAQDLSIYGRT